MDVIVVGIDGSSGSQTALRWAVAEAARHGASVRAVMAWTYLDQHHADHAAQVDHPFDPGYGEQEAVAALRSAVEAAAPDADVDQQTVCDLPARALLEAGEGADLLVVGARGLGGFRGLLLGSVSERVLERATCPVAVIREGDGQGTPDGPVVVAVDASPGGRLALRWAAAEARSRGSVLRLVHAWQVPFMTGQVSAHLIGSVEDGARETLDHALADPALDGLSVEDHLVCGGAGHAVIDRARDACMVVTGSRGLGRLGRVLLGSTSRQLAHHAPCPTVVVPTPEG